MKISESEKYKSSCSLHGPVFSVTCNVCMTMRPYYTTSQSFQLFWSGFPFFLADTLSWPVSHWHCCCHLVSGVWGEEVSGKKDKTKQNVWYSFELFGIKKSITYKKHFLKIHGARVWFIEVRNSSLGKILFLYVRPQVFVGKKYWRTICAVVRQGCVIN